MESGQRTTSKAHSNYQAMTTTRRQAAARLASRRPQRNMAHAFTLMELLIVIAVIAILASLLLPGLSRAKDIAKSVRCKSNLRQMGIGLSLYLQDFAAYPLGDYSQDISTDELFRRWRVRLREYSGEPVIWRFVDPTLIYFKKTGIFQCPGVRANRTEKASQFLFSPFSYENDYYAEHYGYNECGSRWQSPIDGLGGDGFPPPLKLSQWKPVKEEMVKVPSDMIALGDGFFGMQVGKFMERSPLLGRDYIGHDMIPTETKVVRERHRSQANVTFCDGHVEAPKLETLFRDCSDQALRRWNKDNEPHPTDAQRLGHKNGDDQFTTQKRERDF